jgi:hypothetical protein
MTYKVIQWTTGKVGVEAVKAILTHPELELVGAYAWSEEKVGKDVGELCGVEETGIRATHDVDALLMLGADCVCYAPTLPDIDEMVRILESGTNIVSSFFTTGSALPAADRERLVAACQKGRTSLFGSGIFPGFANFIAAIMATASRDFRRVEFLESVDLSEYASFHNLARLGWGQPRDDEKWGGAVSVILGAYIECVDLIGELLHIPLTEKFFTYEPAISTQDGEYLGFPIPKGTISGQKSTWTGKVGEETVIELSVVWRAGENLEPDWPLFHGYKMKVEGTPDVHTEVKFVPSDPNMRADVLAKGEQITATPVVNAIAAVCDAPPGIRTYADLPLITGRYVSKAE